MPFTVHKLNKPGRRAMLPVSLCFFNSLHTALTFTWRPFSASNRTIVVDLYPCATKLYTCITVKRQSIGTYNTSTKSVAACKSCTPFRFLSVSFPASQTNELGTCCKREWSPYAPPSSMLYMCVVYRNCGTARMSVFVHVCVYGMCVCL